jgi:membrane protein DedA with SNARE-associated domain
VATAGAILGDTLGFWIGSVGGYRLARTLGPRMRFDERKLKIAMYLYDAHGAKVVFFGRFVSILRTYAAFLAGMGRMRWRRFLMANASGGILWAGLFTAAAYLGGNTLTHLSTTIDVALVGVAVLAVVATVFLVGRRIDRLALRAEAVFPGPLE